MTNYVIDRQKLKEILLHHKSFIHKRCQKLIMEGVDITKLTYRETNKITDEYIDTMIHDLPIDHLLDEIEVALKKTTGKTSEDYIKEYHQSLSQWLFLFFCAIFLSLAVVFIMGIGMFAV